MHRLQRASDSPGAAGSGPLRQSGSAITLPTALDTNLLVRLLTGDDPEQARRVADLIDASPACFVPITVVLELEWVLRGAYRLERGAVIAALEGLMAIRQVHLEQEDLVRQALAWHQQGLEFADALHLLRSEGCARFATLDRALVNTASGLQLQPVVHLV